MSKYNAKSIVIDGIRFASKDEGRYYEYLKERRAKALIKNFELQPRYELQPSFKKNGKSYKKAEYVADFLIYENDGTETVIDVKGFATETAKLKKKLFEYRYPGLKLLWVVRNLTHGKNGWIEVDELKKIRTKNRVKKGVK